MSREQGPSEAGMRPTANAFGRRQYGRKTGTPGSEAAA